MKYRIAHRPEVESDIAKICQWYDKRGKLLGDRFLLNFAAAIAKIKTRPTTFRIVQDGVRVILTERFPYRIYFRVVRDEVRVLVVIHTARDPVRIDRILRKRSI